MFYVYEHWRPDLDLPFYVGKGSGGRFDPNRSRNKHHRNIRDKLKRLGMCVEVRMVASGLSEDDALSMEIERILFWRSRGVKLSNKTSGGDGLKSPTEDVLEKMRASSKRRWSSIAEREKFSSKTKIQMSDPEARLRVSRCLTGKKASDETRAKMSLSAMGHEVSEETRKKISKAHIGNTHGVGNKSHSGLKASDETKLKMSEAQRARREREKGLI